MYQLYILVDAIRNLKNQLSSIASVFINSFKTDRKICLAKLECQWEKFTFHKSNPKWDKFYYTTDYFCLLYIKARTTKRSPGFFFYYVVFIYIVFLSPSLIYNDSPSLIYQFTQLLVSQTTIKSAM